MPYPRAKQAIGFAFAVNSECAMPASLRIIAKEIEDEGLKSGFYDSDIPHWRELEQWREQGVFLLNTALTVEKKKAGSHLNLWRSFTRQIIKIISHQINPVWLLWGQKAQIFIPYINYNESYSNIVCAPHPAAEAYTGGKSGFYGSDCFNHVNLILEEVKNKSVIKW